MNISDTIKDCQRAVGARVDGNPGVETWTKIRARLLGVEAAEPFAGPPLASAAVDPRSEGIIATLLPEVRPYARALVLRCADHGLTIKVVSGLRSYAEQDALFAQRPKVTKARGGFSNHNFGIGFDIGVFVAGKYLPESPQYKAVGAIGLGLGLEWGGNWQSIQDEPHFELHPPWARELTESQMLAELRRRHAGEIGVFA